MLSFEAKKTIELASESNDNKHCASVDPNFILLVDDTGLHIIDCAKTGNKGNLMIVSKVTIENELKCLLHVSYEKKSIFRCVC